MSMRNLKRLGAMMIAIMVVAAVPAVAKDATLGSFIIQLARTKQVPATDLQVAIDSLARVGVRVPAGMNFDKRLTESDVSRISRVAGLNVTTTAPDRSFDQTQVDRFFTTFAGELTAIDPLEGEMKNGETPDGQSGGAPGNGPPFDPYSKGKGGSKGKKKGHRSPTDPE
jgi:hypothetical protein